MPPNAMSALMRPQRSRLDRLVQLFHERGDIVEADRHAAAILAPGARHHEARRRVQAHDGLRLAHRNPAGLEQSRHDAHAVAAGHGVRAIRLQHDEAGVGVGAGGRDQQVDRHLGAGARLVRHEPPQAAVDGVDVVHLVEHGRARNLRRTADDHLADLALAVDLDQLERTRPGHVRGPSRHALAAAIARASSRFSGSLSGSSGRRGSPTGMPISSQPNFTFCTNLPDSRLVITG